MIRLLLLSLIALFATSCSRETSNLRKGLQAHHWELTRLTINSIDQDLTVLSPDRISLDFEGTRVLGRAAVNHYDGTAKLKGPDQISIGTYGMTEMGGPKHLMDLDDIYLAAFTGVTKATVTGAKLVMESGTARLEYKGMPALPRTKGDPSQTVTHSVGD
jgi:heat shock protein HslJ